MVSAYEFYELLREKGFSFFTGVPDSQLEPLCSILNEKEPGHIVAANEGNAVALAAGYYMAAGKPGLVYMQNSGLGNAVNPVTSLTDPKVYGIPALLLIGWRGKPGVEDEPQHRKQGEITPGLLKLLGIEYYSISEKCSMSDIRKTYEETAKPLLNAERSFAFVIEKGAFLKEKTAKANNQFQMTREYAINRVVRLTGKDDYIISTTGKASRELFEAREAVNADHSHDFLSVGSMGHASMIAAAIAENTNRQVWCIDGDGALLMHLGAAALIGARQIKLKHLLINNGVHESVGGIPTISYQLDWQNIMKSFGYGRVMKAGTKEELESCLEILKEEKGPSFLEILVNTASRTDLTRPTIKPIDNKRNFMNSLRK